MQALDGNFKTLYFSMVTEKMLKNMYSLIFFFFHHQPELMREVFTG